MHPTMHCQDSFTQPQVVKIGSKPCTPYPLSIYRFWILLRGLWVWGIDVLNLGWICDYQWVCPVWHGDRGLWYHGDCCSSDQGC